MKKILVMVLAVISFALLACGTTQKQLASEPTQEKAADTQAAKPDGQAAPANAASPGTQGASDANAPKPALPDETVRTTNASAAADVTGTQAAPATAAPAAAATPAAGAFAGAPAGSPADLADVYFEFDKYDIRDQFRQQLVNTSNWIISNNSTVLIEGHCDARGTNEYNLALGDRRASSVKNFLLASGVPHNKIETVSYGEERPVCTENQESCWSRNRRAHFTLEGSK